MSYLDERRNFIEAGRPLKEKKRTPIKKISDKLAAKLKEQRESGSQSELDKWFDAIIEKHIRPYPHCDNCGEPISEKYFRHAVAHIFPKSIFKSVATNEWNFVKAGSECGCHHDTHRLDTFAKMEIFEVAVRKFRHFEKFITEKHKYLDEFKKHAELIYNNQ